MDIARRVSVKRRVADGRHDEISVELAAQGEGMRVDEQVAGKLANTADRDAGLKTGMIQFTLKDNNKKTVKCAPTRVWRP